MREIKFRIWDIEVERFYYWGITETPPGCLTHRYIQEEAEQFTGLHDSKGREIYEGDKVKVPNLVGYGHSIITIALEDLYGDIGKIGTGYYWPDYWDKSALWVGTVHESA
jgi:hypothetical protein